MITIGDFIYSGTANKLDINNTPDEETKKNCIEFIRVAVEPLEDLFFPYHLVLHSGYRCKELNDTLKGKKNSQHLKGNAIDFHVDGFLLEQAYRVIKNSSLFYDQLILEGKEGHQWIHMSFDTSKPASGQRKQSMELPDA